MTKRLHATVLLSAWPVGSQPNMRLNQLISCAVTSGHNNSACSEARALSLSCSGTIIESSCDWSIKECCCWYATQGDDNYKNTLCVSTCAICTILGHNAVCCGAPNAGQENRFLRFAVTLWQIAFELAPSSYCCPLRFTLLNP